MWWLNLIALCTMVDLGGNKSTLATNLNCNKVMSKIRSWNYKRNIDHQDDNWKFVTRFWRSRVLISFHKIFFEFWFWLLVDYTKVSNQGRCPPQSIKWLNLGCKKNVKCKIWKKNVCALRWWSKFNINNQGFSSYYYYLNLFFCLWDQIWLLIESK